VLPRLSAPKAAAPAPARIRYRPCVRCGKMMNRVNFGSISGAVIDVCKGHGTFLDAGELHQIVTFIHDGGLERARERKLEDLREEERNVREMQRKAASRQQPAARWPPGPEPGNITSGALQELIDLLTQKYR
jgi:Zn-finger nucleic acid-binding protein